MMTVIYLCCVFPCHADVIELKQPEVNFEADYLHTFEWENHPDCLT